MRIWCVSIKYWFGSEGKEIQKLLKTKWNLMKLVST